MNTLELLSEKEKYLGLKNFLYNKFELSTDEFELEEILNHAVKQNDWESNVGYRADRIQHCEREKAFHDQWLKENQPLSWVSNGTGILQDLFIEQSGHPLGPRRVIVDITPRDRYIVATVIQWLGTNVGMSFLREALERCGAHIVFADKNVDDAKAV